MNGPTTILFLTAVRIVLPVLGLLALGTFFERRHAGGVR